MLKSQVLVDFFNESKSQTQSDSIQLEKSSINANNQFEDVASKTIFLGSESLQQLDTSPVSNSSSKIDVMSDFFAPSSCNTCTIDEDDHHDDGDNIPFDESEANTITNISNKIKSKLSKKPKTTEPVVVKTTTPTPVTDTQSKTKSVTAPIVTNPTVPPTRKGTVYKEINPASNYQKMPSIQNTPIIQNNQYGQIPSPRRQETVQNITPSPSSEKSQYVKIPDSIFIKNSACDNELQKKKELIEKKKNKVKYDELKLNELQKDVPIENSEISRLVEDFNKQKENCMLTKGSPYNPTKTSMSFQDVLEKYS